MNRIVGAFERERDLREPRFSAPSSGWFVSVFGRVIDKLLLD